MSVLYQQNKASFDTVAAHYAMILRTQPIVIGLDQSLNVNWLDILSRFFASLVSLLQSMPASDTDRKAAAVAAVLKFYQDNVRPVVAQAVNRPFIFNTFIDPAIVSAIPGIVDGLYDAFVKIITSPSVPPSPTQPALPNVPPGFQPY